MLGKTKHCAPRGEARPACSRRTAVAPCLVAWLGAAPLAHEPGDMKPLGFYAGSMPYAICSMSVQRVYVENALALWAVVSAVHRGS